MNWSKIKSIMICFLITMNIFLLAFLAITTFNESKVPHEVIDASIKVLKRDGFECEKRIIPSSYQIMPSLSAQFYSASSLSDLFFGKQMAFKTSENSLVASEGKATLTVSGNYFLYENGYDADSSYSPGKIKRALEKIGIDMSDSVYDEQTGFFYCMYRNYNLFNMYIEAKVDSDGELCYVSAQWPSKLTPIEKQTFSFTESIMDLKKIFPEGGKITMIECGYSLHHMRGEKYVFSPSWRINVNNIQKIVQ